MGGRVVADEAGRGAGLDSAGRREEREAAELEGQMAFAERYRGMLFALCYARTRIGHNWEGRQEALITKSARNDEGKNMLDMFALSRYFLVLELASTVDGTLSTSAIHTGPPWKIRRAYCTPATSP
jgi:hypothetical protein